MSGCWGWWRIVFVWRGFSLCSSDTSFWSRIGFIASTLFEKKENGWWKVPYGSKSTWNPSPLPSRPCCNWCFSGYIRIDSRSNVVNLGEVPLAIIDWSNLCLLRWTGTWPETEFEKSTCFPGTFAPRWCPIYMYLRSLCRQNNEVHQVRTSSPLAQCAQITAWVCLTFHLTVGHLVKCTYTGPCCIWMQMCASVCVRERERERETDREKERSWVGNFSQKHLEAVADLPLENGIEFNRAEDTISEWVYCAHHCDCKGVAVGKLGLLPETEKVESVEDLSLHFVIEFNRKVSFLPRSSDLLKLSDMPEIEICLSWKRSYAKASFKEISLWKVFSSSEWKGEEEEEMWWYLLQALCKKAIKGKECCSPLRTDVKFAGRNLVRAQPADHCHRASPRSINNTLLRKFTASHLNLRVCSAHSRECWVTDLGPVCDEGCRQIRWSHCEIWLNFLRLLSPFVLPWKEELTSSSMFLWSSINSIAVSESFFDFDCEALHTFVLGFSMLWTSVAETDWDKFKGTDCTVSFWAKFSSVLLS